MATYKLFYKPGDKASDWVIALYQQLAPVNQQAINYQQAIELIDYRVIGTPAYPKPDYLIGYPTLANETTKQIWKGTAAINALESLVQQYRAQVQAAPPPAKQPYVQQQPVPVAANTSSSDAQVMMMGDVSRSGSVVSDDLYISRMPNKSGGTTTSSNKISNDDIAKFNMARA